MLKKPTKSLKKPTDLIKWWNTAIKFYNNKIEYVLAREGELPDSYFQDGLEKISEELYDKIRTRKDIEDNIDQLLIVDYWLRDGYSGLKVSGRY